MKNRRVAIVIIGAVLVAVLLVASAARAAGVIILSIQFYPGCSCGVDPTTGLCCSCPPDLPNPICSTPSLDQFDEAGVYPATRWNLAPDQGGVLRKLVELIDGTVKQTDATVVWEATGSHYSTKGIAFIGPNLKLMSGYLDQDADITFPYYIQITNLPDELALSYRVVIYTLDTASGFGGEYTVNGSAPAFVLAGGNGGVYSGPDFHEAMGNDPAFGISDWGNYVVFPPLSSPPLSGNTVTITASHGPGGSAPINGVQIVSEP